MKLLPVLQNNAHENIEAIAKRVGFSRQKVWRMIKHLEDRDVIWGYSAITNQEKYHTKQFMMFIKRTNNPLDKKIMEKIDSINLEDIALPLDIVIESSCYVHGNYDWIISFIAQDIHQAKIFCDALYNEFPGAIAHIDIQQILYYVRKHYIFNPDRKKLHDLME
ncbi:MAG: Lrp/AsnC family transcriptional regulator [Candidatus Thermoplasmatota archaeon]|nr:Lrp/AsnC family transcriptional regulator [Candidatus Thermoplasmatota archaeon]